VASDTVNVLIVDDDRTTQRALADALTQHGFTVTVERDGEWAVSTFEKKRFEVVVLDVQLPTLTGFEVIKQLRGSAKGKQLPIYLSSGVFKSAIHQREAVQKHKATGFFEKPVDVEKLLAALQNELGARYPKRKAPEPPPPPAEDDENTAEFMADIAAHEEAKVVEAQAKARPARPNGPAIRGEFASNSFAQVLAELYRWRATGALLLRRNQVKKIVYLRDGTPELVKSNLLSECLGRVLVRERIISESECEESLVRMKQSKRQQGTVLIEMGCISPHNLQYGLTLQLQEKLFDVFRWQTGDYSFNPSAEAPAEPISIGMSAAQLIIDGVKRGYDEERLAATFGPSAHKYVYPSEQPLYALQDISVSPEEHELLAVVDGHKTVATLKALALLGPLETDRLFFALNAAQIVELRDKPEGSKRRLPLLMPESDEKTEPSSSPLQPPPLPPPLPPRPSVPPLPVLSVAAPIISTKPPPPVPVEAPVLPASPPPRPATAKPRPADSLLPELSGVTSLDKLSSVESNRREQLAAKVAQMRQQDFFEVLGVDRNADREAVKRAYFVKAKEYHPDRHFSKASGETRALAQQMYELISQAHDTLTDPGERARYLQGLDQGDKPQVGPDVSKLLAAEGKFQRGEELMRQRSYTEALRLFDEAIGLYADEGEFHAWRGWALFQSNPARTEESMVAIEQAIRLNPKQDKSYLFLGYILKAAGRPDKAEKQFEKAIQCNPDCTEALRELRLLGKRR
jgi:DNA-binding response OmpR family regulator/curved DNA-binding protein CbpA